MLFRSIFGAVIKQLLFRGVSFRLGYQCPATGGGQSQPPISICLDLQVRLTSRPLSPTSPDRTLAPSPASRSVEVRRKGRWVSQKRHTHLALSAYHCVALGLGWIPTYRGRCQIGAVNGARGDPPAGRHVRSHLKP